MIALNLTCNTLLAQNVETAFSFPSRLQGLLGRPELLPGQGMLLKPCRSIHTFFMRFAIDVVFTDKEGEIIYLAPNLKPFKATPVIRGACMALELPSGTLSRTGTKKGDLIKFITEEQQNEKV
ncbi:MAG: DUF192 domain-containing protein [Firmicutes bacterium]|nr:DUF192 domain-containing protein [Bacillota bacterium]